MFKVIIILIFFSFYIPANSSPKDKIISQMKLTNILSFNFIQSIDQLHREYFRIWLDDIIVAVSPDFDRICHIQCFYHLFV